MHLDAYVEEAENYQKINGKVKLLEKKKMLHIYFVSYYLVGSSFTELNIFIRCKDCRAVYKNVEVWYWQRSR